MREILFKAKAINRDNGYHRTSYQNGDWVYGLITRLYDERFENLSAEMTDENGVSGIEIDHNTICQYTGLTDKNGNKIWENDILYDEEYFVVRWDEEDARFVVDVYGTKGCLMEYGWDEDAGGYGIIERNGFDDYCSMASFEVIGNIFDNPELIGEQNG